MQTEERSNIMHQSEEIVWVGSMFKCQNKQPPINKMSVSETGRAHIMQISQTVCVCSALGLDHTVPVYGHSADSSDPCQAPITQLLHHFTPGWRAQHGGMVAWTVQAADCFLWLLLVGAIQ